MSSATSTADRVRRRLLEILEQRVRPASSFSVSCSEHEVDAPVRLEGTHVQVVRSSRIASILI
jgi:hypothetical protein